MSDSLTTLISKLQALLLDNGTIFSTTTCTAAIRQALKDFNLHAPVYAGTLVDVVNEQKEYALNTADFTGLLDVLDVLKQGTDTYLDYNVSLDYDTYFEDAAPLIRLHTAESSGTLIIRYSLPYTILGLDSEVESTLPAFFDAILLDGGAYYACMIRSAGRVESNNLDRDTSENYKGLVPIFKLAFETGLAIAGRRRPPVGEPDQRTWNDGF